MKTAMRAITKPMAPTTNTSPLMRPRAAMPRVKQEEERPADQHRAIPHSELPVVEGAEGTLEDRELPARDANREPLAEGRREAQDPDADQAVCEYRVMGVSPPERERRQQEGNDGQQPPAVMGDGLDESRRFLAPEGEPGDPVEAPETVVDGIPGQDREPDPADRGP